MPTYTYRREDGTTFDIEQRITDDRLTTCPTTGQPVERLISGGGGLVFKGSGFYQTDYVRPSGESRESDKKASKPEKTEKSEKSEKTEKKASGSTASTD